MKKIFTSLFSLFLLFGAMNAVAAEYPFKVTTDAENPELYAIKSGRGDTYWWTFNPSDGLISLAAYTYVDEAQYWYFMEVTEGETTYLQLYPYLGKGKAMGYNDPTAGAAKVSAVAPGTEGYDCRWIFDNNGGNAPYGLKTSNNAVWLSHYGGGANKMGFWTNGPAGDGGSAMYFQEVKVRKNPEAFLAAVNDMLGDMQAAYGLVQDASQFSSNAVEPKEGALANLIDGNYSTFFHSAWSVTVAGTHHLQVEVSEPVESFSFYFKKRHNNNNNRPTDLTILGSADGVEFAEVAHITTGLPTSADTLDYMSEIITLEAPCKYLRFAVNKTNNNTAFFTFSEFYLFPGEQLILDAVALTNAFVASDDYLDQFLAAHRKVQVDKAHRQKGIAIAEAKALLAAASENHAEAPALGQYSTAAYNAFEAIVAEYEAQESATLEDVDALNEAIKNFHMAKNMPVFVIGGVIEYAKDKYIYDKSAEIPYFKDLDLADESMLWAFDMTSTEVGVKDSAVVVRNLATGNLFWNSAYIKVTETADANDEDGQFLFYVDHQTNPVHARQSDSGITTWASNTANSGSAWKFTYVGTTYDLYDLSALAWAESDVVKNADLASTESWTAVGGGYAHNAGKRVAEFYAGWGALDNTSGSLLQEVTLPAGTYRLTGKAFYRFGGSFNVDASKSLGYMVAGDNKVAVKTLGSVEGLDAYANSIDEASAAFYDKDLYTNVLEFTLTDSTTLNLGFECTHEEKQSWFIVGEVKLESATDVPGALSEQFVAEATAFCSLSSMAMYSLGGVMARWETMTAQVMDLYALISEGGKVLDAKVAKLMKDMAAFTAEVAEIDEIFGQFNEVKFGCFDIQDNSTAEADVAAAFEAVVGATYNTANIATLADLENLIAKLIAACNAYVLNAVPNAGFTFDYTFLIEGVGNSIEGWEKNIDGFHGNFVYKHSAEKNTAELQKTGFIEAWNPEAYKGTISYTATDLPNGYYKVSAYTFANGSTSFFANNKSAAVTSEMYVQPVLDSVYVYNGTLEFGLNVENANWVGITNIELAFIAPKPVVEVASVTLDKTEAALVIVGDSVSSVQLVATVAPYDADEQTVVWTSSDEAVATVDANGVVTAVGAGEATITATCGEVSATCVVTVTIEQGIANLEVEADAVIYDLTGRRVEKMEKGIYIVNGKKVYVK